MFINYQPRIFTVKIFQKTYASQFPQNPEEKFPLYYMNMHIDACNRLKYIPTPTGVNTHVIKKSNVYKEF